MVDLKLHHIGHQKGRLHGETEELLYCKFIYVVAVSDFHLQRMEKTELRLDSDAEPKAS